MTLLFIVLLPLLGALLPAIVFPRVGSTSAWVAAAVTGASFVLLLRLAAPVFAGDTLYAGWSWLPALGINITFRLDGLGLLFGLLILGIGLLVILYAGYYLSSEDSLPRFYAFFLLFMGAMLGIVLSENVILLLMFWELTSLSSFLLIGYWFHRADARQGALMALAVTGGGGLALLAGLLLLGGIVGSFELTDILLSGAIIQQHSLYPLALVLVLLGAFTKSAQFPFHFWLPHAMAAPTPVSAYLHSATMVKAGIFLLARLFPALSGTDLWFYLVSGTGLVTLVLGAYIALFQHDLKGLLAYSTISHLGLITLLFGLGTPLGEVAGIFHIVNHATFKASLFMAAGIIDHEAGTRDMRRINGLFKYMPQTAVLAMVAAAAMAGVPLLNGFLSKEMFFGETLHLIWLGGFYWALPAAAVVAGAFSVAYSVRFIHDVFFHGKPIGLSRTPHEPPIWMKIPVAILVAVCLLVGVFPEDTVAPLLTTAASSVLLGQPLPAYDLAVWHGWNWPLLMSFIALASGIVIYTLRYGLFSLQERFGFRGDGKTLFDAGLALLLTAARWFTATLENGSLQRYLALLFASVVVLLLAALVKEGSGLTGPVMLTPVNGMTLVAAFILIAGAVGTVLKHRQRLSALIVFSVIGLLIALAFVEFSAPDLALTQLLVEMAAIVLLLLALYFLPRQTPREASRLRLWRDGVLALLTGVALAALTWGLLTRPYETIADYYLANSLPGGGGSNVVNVILVDFRGFDTLGEISVLAIAALGIYALLDGLRLSTPATDLRGQPWAKERHPLVMEMIARPQLPIALMVAVYLFLRGHNLPGGGFIAGLLTAMALILQYLASGFQWTQERFRFDSRPLIALGLLCTLLTGLGSWVFARPFLTSTFIHVHWPLIGEFELASALAFDLGVYLTVIGVVMLILVRLGALSLAAAGDRQSHKESRRWKP